MFRGGATKKARDLPPRHRCDARIAPVLTAKQVFSLGRAAEATESPEREGLRAAGEEGVKKERPRENTAGDPRSLKVEGITPLKLWGGVKPGGVNV